MGVIGTTYRDGAPYSTSNLGNEQFCAHCSNQGLVVLDRRGNVGAPCPMCAKGRAVDVNSFDGLFWLRDSWKRDSWNGGMDWSGWDRRRNTNPVAKRLMDQYERVLDANGGARPTVATLNQLVKRVSVGGVS